MTLAILIVSLQAIAGLCYFFEWIEGWQLFSVGLTKGSSLEPTISIRLLTKWKPVIRRIRKHSNVPFQKETFYYKELKVYTTCGELKEWRSGGHHLNLDPPKTQPKAMTHEQEFIWMMVPEIRMRRVREGGMTSVGTCCRGYIRKIAASFHHILLRSMQCIFQSCPWKCGR
jgi:hypothetical protein